MTEFSLIGLVCMIEIVFGMYVIFNIIKSINNTIATKKLHEIKQWLIFLMQRFIFEFMTGKLKNNSAQVYSPK